jgi:hypothetical protein
VQAAPTGRNSKEKGEKDCRTVGADADGLRSRPRWRRDFSRWTGMHDSLVFWVLRNGAEGPFRTFQERILADTIQNIPFRRRYVIYYDVAVTAVTAVTRKAL